MYELHVHTVSGLVHYAVRITDLDRYLDGLDRDGFVQVGDDKFVCEFSGEVRLIVRR